MSLDVIRERAAERRADQLISQLEISDVGEIDIEAIAMTQDALVIDGGLAGAEARLSRSPKLSFIRINNAIREPGRRRFAIAHELGHLLLQQSSQFALCTDKDLVPFYTNSPDELEASVFGAALLMPGRMFEPLCRTARPSLKYVSELATQFQVTLTAASSRYIHFCPHRCCLVVSTDGKTRYHRKTKDFGYFIAPREKLNPATYAADFFKGERLPEGMQEVLATSWLEGARIDSSKTILEESIAMPSYESVLTLLWIDKDIDQYITGEDEYDAEERESDSRWSWNRYRDRE
ncbi:MAG: ImmA/IrrE family metallo-endopeptidase [Acidobacteriota bacterium]